ncbi:MAG: hypothetical protein R2834_18065 [Rhodothermales bacterium]
MKRICTQLTLVFALVFNSCAQSPSPVSESPEMPVMSVIDATAHSMTPAMLEGRKLTPEERSQLAETGLNATVLIHRTIANASNWREAHAALQLYLRADTESPSYLREQIVSVRMLQLILSGPERDADAMAAIAQYTELLSKNRSPEGALLVQALQTLKGYWTPEQIADAAQGGMVGIEAFLARRTCPDCADKQHSPAINAKVQAGEDVFLMQIEHALDQLKAMSTL